MGDNLSGSSLPTADWKTSPPPPELLHTPPGTSDEIEGVLEGSIRYMQAKIDYERYKLDAERDRLERQQLAEAENNLQRRQEQQERHLLAVFEERSERQPTVTGSNMQRREQLAAEEYNSEDEQLAAETLGLPVETPSGHRRNVSAPANVSKGKQKGTQESQEGQPNVDSQQTPSRHGFDNRRSSRSSVIAPIAQPSQTQTHISTLTPEGPAAQANSSTAALVSPPAYEEVWFAALEESPAFQASRPVSLGSPPAYVESSSTAAARPPANSNGSSTLVGCPSADIGSFSLRKWSLRHLRPYLTTVFKPGSRSNRGILSRGTSGSTSKSVECVSCMEDFSVKEMVHLTCHDYCSPCFTLLIETSISTETSWPAKCCLNEIPKAIILNHLRGKLKSRYETMVEERSIAIEDRVYCSKPSCGSWIPLHKIDKPLFLARCSRCRHKTCIICRGSYHSNGECPDDPNLRETLRCAINAGWRRCYKCNALVEHEEGCSHMTCRCNAQFCYTCGLRWKTCGCTEDELEVHLTAAQWRSENEASQTHVRQAALAALGREVGADQAEFSNELREVLNLLENSEEGSPEERAAEQRALAVAAQREAEEDRARDFEDRLQRLREELDFVHSIQLIANFDRFEAENKALADGAKEDLARMDKVFNILPPEEIARERAKYVAFFREGGFEPPDAMINGLVEAAAWSRTWERENGTESDAPNYRMTPEEHRKSNELAEYVEIYKRFGMRHSDLRVDLVLGGATTAKAKAHQLVQERRHSEQKDMINAKLEAKQERLRAGHRSDKRWFEEVATVREAMLTMGLLDEIAE